jgi:ATP-dependent DNA ligase
MMVSFAAACIAFAYQRWRKLRKNCVAGGVSPAVGKLTRPPMLYVDHIECSGRDLFNTACQQDLERIVAKLADGRYEPEKTTWVKIKNRSYSQVEGRRSSSIR